MSARSLILRHREVFLVRTFNYYAERRWSNPIDAHQNAWIIVLSPHLWCEWQCERARFLRGCSNFPQHYECQEAPRRAWGKGKVWGWMHVSELKEKKKKEKCKIYSEIIFSSAVRWLCSVRWYFHDCKMSTETLKLILILINGGVLTECIGMTCSEVWRSINRQWLMEFCSCCTWFEMAFKV